MTEPLVVLTRSELRELLVEAVAEALHRAPVDEVLTTEEAAKLLKIHPKTLAKRAREGKVPAERSGNDWRFRRSQIMGR